MDEISIVSFRYHAKFGHFRKPYSNVSSLSYPFPPRTALAGLIGAILGVPKAEVPLKLDTKNLKVAVEIDSFIKTFTHVTNFRQDSSGGVDYSIRRSKRLKKSESKNIPDCNKAALIPQEILRYPSYIVYINLNDNMDEFISRIKNKRFVYTPCMGLSGFLAEIDYISEGLSKPLDPGEYDVSTVTDKDNCSLSLNWLNDNKEDRHVLEVRAPYLGTPDRKFTYKRYLLNMLSRSLPLRMTNNAYEFENKIISFL